jgi:hypothetical protein
MLYPLHPPWLDHSNYIWRKVRVMTLPSMQFSPSFYVSSVFCPNILLNILFSNTFSLCSSLNVRVQVSHPYKTTGKITVLYILLFTLLNSSYMYTYIYIHEYIYVVYGMFIRSAFMFTSDAHYISLDWSEWKLIYLKMFKIIYICEDKKHDRFYLPI